MKAAGYHSKLVGKWHLGIQTEHWPQEYGFDGIENSESRILWNTL